MRFHAVIFKGVILTSLSVCSFVFPSISNANGGVPSPVNSSSESSARPTASSIMSPTGFGLGWGQIGIGLGYVNHWIGTNDDDGFGLVAMGFGDPKKVALTANVLIDSIGGDDPFAKNGTAGFKLSHEFADGRSAVAVGVANVIPWGVFNDYANSYYAVGTHVFNLTGSEMRPLPLVVSAGIGTGAFSSPEDFQADKESVNGFGSVALKVLPYASIIADWTDSDLAMGVSVSPFAKIPVVLGASMMNVVGEDDSSKAFLLTAAFGFDFSEK